MPKRSSAAISTDEGIGDGKRAEKRPKSTSSSSNAAVEAPIVVLLDDENGPVAQEPVMLSREVTVAKLKAIVTQAPHEKDRARDTDFHFSMYLIQQEQNRFYEISVVKSSLHISYGLVGSSSNKKVNAVSLCSPYAAITSLEDKVLDKLRKGYRETAPNTNQPQATAVKGKSANQQTPSPPQAMTKLVKALGPGDPHYNDHLFHVALIPPQTMADGVQSDWHVESQYYVNRSYSTSSKRKFKTEAAAKKFMQSKLDEYLAKGYVPYE